MNENKNITFDEIREKIIVFYHKKANDKIIQKHLDKIFECTPISIIANIIYLSTEIIYNNLNEYNYHVIITFINSSYATQYLYEIYSKYVN